MEIRPFLKSNSSGKTENWHVSSDDRGRTNPGLFVAHTTWRNNTRVFSSSNNSSTRGQVGVRRVICGNVRRSRASHAASPCTWKTRPVCRFRAIKSSSTPTLERGYEHTTTHKRMPVQGYKTPCAKASRSMIIATQF